jgi:hypothetical protein
VARRWRLAPHGAAAQPRSKAVNQPGCSHHARRIIGKRCATDRASSGSQAFDILENDYRIRSLEGGHEMEDT